MLLFFSLSMIISSLKSNFVFFFSYINVPFSNAYSIICKVFSEAFLDEEDIYLIADRFELQFESFIKKSLS